MASKKKERVDWHPIRVVSRRTGLTPDVLRAWERRYGAVRPSRTSGRRLYNDADVERLRLLRRAASAGRRIGQISSLSTPALKKLVSEDERAMESEPKAARTRLEGSDKSGPREEHDLGAVLDECIGAVNDLDAAGLEAALARAMVSLGRVALAEKVALRLMEEIGSMWQEGTLRVAHEHLASAVVRSFLGEMGNGGDRKAGGPLLVMATPLGQHHELGALAAVTTAASGGWQVTYLGPDLPADEIAAAAGMKNASAVALSIIYPADDPNLDRELRRLRRLLPAETAILVGGRAAEGYEETLQSIQAIRANDMQDLRARLAALRQPS
jgi:DNA-binding transcriptional MerR regulator/methylmalonyl-CoA mutase cobalamin-binding subunit